MSFEKILSSSGSLTGGLAESAKTGGALKPTANAEEANVKPTDGQLKIASEIDAKVRELTRLDVTEPILVFEGMIDFLPGFKVCMDAGEETLNELGQRFYGFYLYAKVLKEIAGDIESGALVVPK